MELLVIQTHVQKQVEETKRRLLIPYPIRLDGCKDKPVARGSVADHGGDFLTAAVSVIRNLAKAGLHVHPTVREPALNCSDVAFDGRVIVAPSLTPSLSLFLCFVVHSFSFCSLTLSLSLSLYLCLSLSRRCHSQANNT